MHAAAFGHGAQSAASSAAQSAAESGVPLEPDAGELATAAVSASKKVVIPGVEVAVTAGPASIFLDEGVVSWRTAICDCLPFTKIK